MQNISQRINPAPAKAPEDANSIPITRADGVIREFVRQDTGHLRREPESPTQVITDVSSFVQRVAGVSLTELENVILELQNLRGFLYDEGERIQREISAYLQLSQTAIGSIRIIANNIVDWKETADSTAHTVEKRRAETDRASANGPAPADVQ